MNIANGDMVGHTGVIQATIVACKAADEAVKMILDAIEQVGGIYVVTADHGNAEDMVKRDKCGQPLYDKNGQLQILTSHTCHPVSFQSLSSKENSTLGASRVLFNIFWNFELGAYCDWRSRISAWC